MADANKTIEVRLDLKDGKARGQLKTFDNQLKSTANSGRNLGGAVRGAAGGMQAMGAATKRTNIAMMNAGRLIEDSAFGLRGMSNNITPAITSFNSLKQEVGSTSKALRIFARSMITATGAVSVIVPILITLALTVGPKLARGFKEGEDAAVDFDAKLKELIATAQELDDKLTQIQLGDRFNDQLRSVTELAEAYNETAEKVAKYERQLKFHEKGTPGFLKVSGQLKEAEEEHATALEALTQAQENVRKAERNRQAEEAKGAAGGAGGSTPEAELALRGVDVEYLVTEVLMQQLQQRLEARRQYNEQSASMMQQDAANAREVERIKAETAKQEAEVLRQKTTLEQDILAVGMSNQATSAKEAANVMKDIIANEIRLYMLKAIARTIAESSKFGPLGFLIGAGASVAVTTAFNALISQLPSFRSGVTNFGGGLAQVHRDEILALPPGTDVVSQARSRQATRGGVGGMTPEVKVVVSGDMTSFIDKVDIESQRNGRAHVGSAAAFTR